MAAHQAPRPWDSPGKNTGVGCHFLLQCTKVKSESEVTQSCPTLCDPMDGSLPGSSIHGIFQARVLEWVAIAFSKRPQIAKEILRKKDKAGSITLPDFKLYYKAIVVKTMWSQHKNRHRLVEQNWEFRNNPCTCGQLMFDTEAKNTQCRKDSLFNSDGNIGYSHIKQWSKIKQVLGEGGEKRSLVQYWWECKLLQPLWKTVWRFLKKLKIE